MDEIDKKILINLQNNVTIPLSELSKKVGISSTPCWSRIKKLESERIIAELEKKLKEGEKFIQDIRNHKEMPEEFKKQLLKVYSNLIKGLENKISSLKLYI